MQHIYITLSAYVFNFDVNNDVNVQCKCDN